MAYENILKALGRSGEGLSQQQQSDNYRAFSEIMREGVYIPDMISQIDSLKARVEALEHPNPVDAELFTVMESTVREDTDVRTAKDKLATAKTRVISELCMKDTDYRRLFEEYRTLVHTKYVERNERNKGVA